MKYIQLLYQDVFNHLKEYQDEDEKKLVMATRGNLELIFPLIPYKLEFYIQDHYESEEKTMK